MKDEINIQIDIPAEIKEIFKEQSRLSDINFYFSNKCIEEWLKMCCESLKCKPHDLLMTQTTNYPEIKVMVRRLKSTDFCKCPHCGKNITD